MRRPAVKAGLYSTRGELRPTPPFDFAKSLAFAGRFTPSQLSPRAANGAASGAADRAAKGALTRATCLGAETLVFRVESTGTVARPRLRYTLWSGQPISRAMTAALAGRIRFFLSLDDDLRPFYRIGRRDPRFEPVIDALYGYHHVKFLTPFETACWAVLTQRNRMAIARSLREAMIQRLGPALEVNGIVHRAFPEPVRVAQASDDDLIAIARQARRARYLRAVAQAFDGADEAFLRTGGYDDVEAWLRAIPGIGPWSARFILIRSLGRMERLAFTEAALGHLVTRIYGADRKPPPAIDRIARRYGQWQGYWAHYLRVLPAAPSPR